MISKEKLQELIDKKEKIYYMERNYFNNVVCFPLIDVYIEKSDRYGYFLTSKSNSWNFAISSDYFTDSLSLQDLYETEDDAKEFIKYGNITKTLKFPFVSYNDFLRGKTIDIEDIVSVGKATKFDCIVIWDMVKGKQQIIDYATRENYHKALDIAKNIWLGV